MLDPCGRGTRMHFLCFLFGLCMRPFLEMLESLRNDGVPITMRACCDDLRGVLQDLSCLPIIKEAFDALRAIAGSVLENRNCAFLPYS